ncbi:hypothetical protein KM043_008579 [Ampulex compressa]|nr:hypothetical protein KM043_008579 [Ampulex compressa]
MDHSNYTRRSFIGLEHSNTRDQGPEESRGAREAIVAESIGYLAVYLSWKPRPVETRADVGLSSVKKRLVPVSLPFLFRETIILEHLGFVAIVSATDCSSSCAALKGRFAGVTVLPAWWSTALDARVTGRKGALDRLREFER